MTCFRSARPSVSLLPGSTAVQSFVSGGRITGVLDWRQTSDLDYRRRRNDSGNDWPRSGHHPVHEDTPTCRGTFVGWEQLMTAERAVLAGGCFWGVQELFRELPGVTSTRVGYAGGDTPNATYTDHDKHAEAIEIEFDPEVITYRHLLEFFFRIHDPTTKNRQGNDVGTSYRSLIQYTSPEQKWIAEETIAAIEASGRWPGNVVTDVEPASEFWDAEEEHQDYLRKHLNGYTCHYIRPGWVLDDVML